MVIEAGCNAGCNKMPNKTYGHGPENSHKRICLKEEVLFAEILSLAVPPKTVCMCVNISML